MAKITQIVPVKDTTPLVRGSSDNTKKVRIEADGLTTATTRVITMPDKDIDLDNVVKHNRSASTAPNKTNDGTEGYELNSHWIDTTHNRIYICIDTTTDEAKWITPGGEFVSNKTGVLIAKGSIVYQNGAQGGVPTIALAKADAESTSAGTWGMVVEDIADNGFGYVVYSGPVYTLDTSAFSNGDTLFLSATTAGNYQSAPAPTAPNHSVFIGHVDLSHANDGIINIKIDNGFESTELHDFDETAPTIAGQVPRYNGTNKMIYQKLSDADITGSVPNISGATNIGGILDDIDTCQFNEKNTGIISWGDSGDYYDEAFTGGKFKLLRGGSGCITSKPLTWSGNQETGVLSANATHYIYIDSSGLIQSTTIRTGALFEGNIVLFEVLYDGTNYEVVNEAHPLKYPAATSNDAHDTIGTVFEKGDSGILERVTTGTGSVATDRQLKQVGSSEIHDHGLESSFADSSGAGVSFGHYYTNGSGYYNKDSQSATFPMKYNNSGTATSITENRFGIFRIFYSKDDLNTAGGKRYSLMHTDEFTTLILAQTAINSGSIVQATNEFKSLEFAQYGYVIVKNTATGGHIVDDNIITEKDTAGGSITQSGGSNNASAVNTDTTNFNGILSSADSTVQAALETIDDSIASTTTAGVIEIATTAEINSGTADRAMAPDQFKTSNPGSRVAAVAFVESDTAVTVADGTVGIPITAELNGHNIIDAYIFVHDKGITGTTDVQVRRRRAGSNVDVLSTKITLGDEYYANDGVINTSNDDLATGDIVYFDVDAIHSGTAPNGATGVIITQLP